MRCLTKDECSAWLKEQGITEEPYEAEKCPTKFASQIDVPSKPIGLSKLIRFLLVHCPRTFNGALLVARDWPFYTPDEMLVVDALRRCHGESRHLIEAPGHLFGKDEIHECAALANLVMTFGWSAYVYEINDGTTYNLWEGDLIDYWSDNSDVADHVTKALKVFGLNLVRDLSD